MVTAVTKSPLNNYNCLVSQVLNDNQHSQEAGRVSGWLALSGIKIGDRTWIVCDLLQPSVVWGQTEKVYGHHHWCCTLHLTNWINTSHQVVFAFDCVQLITKNTFFIHKWSTCGKSLKNLISKSQWESLQDHSQVDWCCSNWHNNQKVATIYR